MRIKKKYHYLNLIALATFSLLFANHCRADDEKATCHYVKLATIPINFSDLTPTFEGSINGNKVIMLMDTGDPETHLMGDFVEKFKIPVSHAAGTVGGVGGESAKYAARLHDFAIGSLKSDSMTLPVMSDMGVHGYGALVGANFLFQRDLEISFAEKQIKFFHPVGCDNAYLAYWDDNATEVPIQDLMIKDSRQRIDVELNGHKVRAVIDTGAMLSSITPLAAARAGVTPKSPGVTAGPISAGGGKGTVASWVAPFDTFSIGGETIKHPKILIMDMWAALLADNNNAAQAEAIKEDLPEMLLGADFLSAHRVLFAVSQHRAYISYLGGKVFDVGDKPVTPAR